MYLSYIFSIVNPKKDDNYGNSVSEDCVGSGPRNKGQSCNRTCKKGQSQAATAKLLGIAPSAVSQYISGKRGYRIEFQGETKELIEKLAQDLIDNKVPDFVARICEICVSARGSKKSAIPAAPKSRQIIKRKIKQTIKQETKQKIKKILKKIPRHEAGFCRSLHCFLHPCMDFSV